MGSLTIKDFLSDLIEIECKQCDRHGRYRKAALIEKYGSDIILPNLLALIADDCDQRKPLLGNRGWGAIYPALARAQKRNPPLEFP